MEETILVCTDIKFYCLKDEDAFFEWIKKIACITHTSAAGRELYLHISAQKTSDQDLDDLIGLFYRYKVDMAQLAQFLTDDNKVWFHDNKKAFWHKRVFGAKNGQR
jgi:hypothetical protein